MQRVRQQIEGEGVSGLRAVAVVAAVAVVVMMGSVAPAAAQVTVQAQVGTTGIGGGVGFGFADVFAVRVLGNAAPDIERSERAGDNRYNAHLDLASAMAVLDWHPMGGGFRLTAGAMYDGNHVDGDSVASVTGNYTIGNLQLPAVLVGTLHGRIDYSTFAPYAGFGWGISPRSTPGWGFTLDAGVAYLGRPRVTLTPELPPGSPLNSPAAQAILAPELAIEASRIEQKIDNYRYYPVLSAGLAYRF